MLENLVHVGRDPGSVRFSYQMLDMTSRASGGSIAYYQSEQAFVDSVEPLIELGISEFGLYYPALEEQMPMLERIMTSTIPALKSRYAAGV